MAYTYGQTYEEEKQEVIKFLDMQMDTKREIFSSALFLMHSMMLSLLQLRRMEVTI